MQTNDKMKLGIFVTIGIALFIAALFIIGNRQNIFDSTYRLTTYYSEVGGLQKGNNIWFAGVKVGTVAGVVIESDTSIRVDMNVLTNAKNFIKKDSKASISSEGFLGNKIILIEAGSPSAELAVEGDALRGMPGLDTDAMLATLEKTNANLVNITANISQLSDRIVEGEGSLGELLADTVMVTRLNQTLASLQQTGNNAARTSRDLAKLTADIEAGNGLVGALLRDTSYANQLSATMGNVSTTGDEVAKAAAQLTGITENLSRVLEAAQSPDAPLGVLLKDPEFARDLQQTMQNLEAGTSELESTLETAQESFIMRKRILKKNKPKKEKE
ncbi:MAG: MlaD family protein [Bacteroidota bacterium]